MGKHSSNAIFLKNSSSTGRNCDFKHRVAREKKKERERERERRNFFTHCRPLPFLDPVFEIRASKQSLSIISFQLFSFSLVSFFFSFFFN